MSRVKGSKEDVKIKNQIDFVEAFNYCAKYAKLYIITAVAAFVLAAVYVFSIPRFYKAEVELAPELSGDAGGGSLMSLAQQFGLGGVGANVNSDAIYPELYPDLFTSKEFLVSLFDVKIKTAKNDSVITLYDYYLKGQKSPWWNYPIAAIIKGIKTLRGGKKNALGAAQNGSKVNPFRLSETQNMITEAIAGAVTCNVDKHTSVISIMATAQDPVAAAIIVDSVRLRLQDFIIAYRTKKARNDVAYCQKLLCEAKQKYETCRRAYASFSDSHEELYLTSYKSESENLENEMQLAFNAYSQVAQQLQIAQAKVLEKTPVFTTIKSATVPLKAAGPHRLTTIFILMVFAVVGVTALLLSTRTLKERKMTETEDNDIEDKV